MTYSVNTGLVDTYAVETVAGGENYFAAVI
jgi:hypothetical protein